MRRWAMLAIVAAAAAGCARAPDARYPNPLTFATTDSATIEAVARRVLWDMRFDILYPESREGVLETEPLTGASWFEFWRDDTVGRDQRTEASFYTIRRRVTVEVKPVPGSENGAEAVVKVLKQRLSAPQAAVGQISGGFDIYNPNHSDLTRRDELIGSTHEWIDVGRDEACEQYILQKIQARLGESSKP